MANFLSSNRNMQPKALRRIAKEQSILNLSGCWSTLPFFCEPEESLPPAILISASDDVEFHEEGSEASGRIQIY